MPAPTETAVLEMGGTHASSRWVDAEWRPGPECAHVALRSDAPADEILDGLATCVAALGELDGRVLAAAVPGPFDYAGGVGRYRDVGKYESLNGVDVRTGLTERLPSPPARITFLNDAQAFGLGEWLTGAGRDCTRVLAITLGTGVGSAFVDDGTVVTTGDRVPPRGELHLTRVAGVPLEDVVSRRAMLARYRAAGGPAEHDVADIAGRAASDPRAQDAFCAPLRTLGEVLSDWAPRFGAELIVVGGAMSRSWTLVEPALRTGLAIGGVDLPVARSDDPDRSAAVGAAWHARRV